MIECDICGREFTHHNHDFTHYNQHLEAHYRRGEYRRGEGLEKGVEVECKICGKTFTDSRGNLKHVENMRKMHMKVHEPRSVLSPIAKDKMFKSVADAVKNVQCDICGREFTHHNHEFTHYNQHLEAHYGRGEYRRGEGLENGVEVECKICGKTFKDSRGNLKHVENMRKMHMKVHEPRSVLCPIAQDKMFKSVADAVKHVESGACKMCPGRERARQAIFDFLKTKPFARNFMNPMLEYDGDYGGGDVPDYPYKCNQCHRIFKNVSSLMQHQADSDRCDDVTSRLGKLKLH